MIKATHKAYGSGGANAKTTDGGGSVSRAPDSPVAQPSSVLLEVPPTVPKAPNKAPRSWAKVVSDFSKQGTSLKFVSPNIVDSKVIVKLQESELNEGLKKWEHTMVLSVVGFVPSIAAVRNFITKTWSMSGFEIFKHDNGFFLIKCAPGVDM